MSWFVYMLRCADGSLYTGVARNIEKRLQEHNAGRGAKYTRGRVPAALVYREECGDQGLAARRESIIKRMTRIQKIGLIEAETSRESMPGVTKMRGTGKR